MWGRGCAIVQGAIRQLKVAFGGAFKTLLKREGKNPACKQAKSKDEE